MRWTLNILLALLIPLAAIAAWVWVSGASANLNWYWGHGHWQLVVHPDRLALWVGEARKGEPGLVLYPRVEGRSLLGPTRSVEPEWKARRDLQWRNVRFFAAERAPAGEEYQAWFYVVWVPYWLLAALPALPMLLRMWLARSNGRIRRRAKAGLCVRCGYDLRATPRQCPECGHAPAEADVPPALPRRILHGAHNLATALLLLVAVLLTGLWLRSYWRIDDVRWLSRWIEEDPSAPSVKDDDSPAASTPVFRPRLLRWGAGRLLSWRSCQGRLESLAGELEPSSSARPGPWALPQHIKWVSEAPGPYTSPLPRPNAAGVDVAEFQDNAAPWRIRVRWRVPILLLVGVALVLPGLRVALRIRARRRGRSATES